MDFDQRQREQDEQHLGLLTIFNYVYAAFNVIWVMFAVMYVLFIGALFVLTPTPGTGGPGGAGTRGGPQMTYFVSTFACVVASSLLISLSMAAGTAVCARCLSQRRGRIFCFVMSGINCLQVPLGTLLGVFTIIVLSRDSVREMFEETARANQAGDLHDEIPPPN